VWHVIADDLQTVTILDKSFGDDSFFFEPLIFLIIWTLEQVVPWVELLSHSLLWNLNVKRKRDLWTGIDWFFELVFG
jgi:hypothetical protein